MVGPQCLMAQLFTVLLAVSGSPFDPHPLPWRGPWFEGWFTRIVDPAAGRSIAVIFGSYEPHKLAGHFSQAWVAVLVSDANGSMHTEQSFPDPASVRITRRGEPVTRQPSDSPAEFEWTSEVGHLNVSRGSYALEFTMPSGLHLSASLQDRKPWSTECPDSCGPEGWLRHLPSFLLPTHYFVETLAATAQYALGHQVGRGYGHMETNYGAYFPVAWVWVQALAADGRTQLLATWGDYIPGLKQSAYVIGYRSHRASWDFRTTDLGRFHAEVDNTHCNVSLSAVTLRGHRRLELDVSAPCSTFSDPLYFPTRHGFSNTPGSIESYSAVAHVRIFNGAGELLDSAVIPQTALEFGGGFCPASERPSPQAADAIFA